MSYLINMSVIIDLVTGKLNYAYDESVQQSRTLSGKVVFILRNINYTLYKR